MKLAQIYERYSLLWITIALGLIYWVPSLIWYDRLLMPVKWTTYSVSLVVMAVVFVSWLPAAFRTFRNNSTEAPDLLILAVFLGSFVFLQSVIARYVDLHMEGPYWLYYSPIGGFIAYQTAILGTLITVAVAKSSTIHLESLKRRIGWGLFISGLLVGTFIGSMISNLGTI